MEIKQITTAHNILAGIGRDGLDGERVVDSVPVAFWVLSSTGSTYGMMATKAGLKIAEFERGFIGYKPKPGCHG